MKKILFFFISLCGVMQAQITLSHESGIVPYGTEITITAPSPTDTIWYAWDGHNPFSVYGQYVVGSGTIVTPEPDENAPYWSKIPTTLTDPDSISAFEYGGYVLEQSMFQGIQTIRKENILRVNIKQCSNCEIVRVFVSPYIFSVHPNVPIVFITVDQEDYFGPFGIGVAGDSCLRFENISYSDTTYITIIDMNSAVFFSRNNRFYYYSWRVDVFY
ncbi:MAG: hypothetical protein LRY46_02165 [Candidatus Pacebacteria bacterium]|nr:hypothetical protein [Candidatus Paceibacterota bacterium]